MFFIHKDDIIMIGLYSKKISQIPHLSEFLGSRWVRLPTSKKMSAIAGWGAKPTADRARAEAAKRGLPYISIEDGFLRSLGLGFEFDPISLIVDYTGVYYDCNRPSDLENILNSRGWETPELIGAARNAIAGILEHNLSKYNHAPEAPRNLFGSDDRKKILLLDQTFNDMSITLGGADALSFQNMLHNAIETNKDVMVFIKTHPDVISGKKKGYLLGNELPENTKIIGKDYAPLSLLSQADMVYTVTSQMGFEALLLNKEVHCFGMPFYSGWGLTIDRLGNPRRKIKRTVEEVFAAAYILYARYVNPFTGKKCDIDEAVNIVADQRRRNEANRGLSVCVGFSRWKRGLARSYLNSTGGTLRFFKNYNSAIKCAKTGSGRIVIWASKEPPELDERCKKIGVDLIRMEDGFIRSVGLGSEFNYPFSLVLDNMGIYYDPLRPSSIEKTLQETVFSRNLLDRAKALRNIIIKRAITKYNLNTDAQLISSRPRNRRVILVVGQVDDDASVRLGGCGISSNTELIQAVRRANEDAFIIYKPHPDVLIGNRPGEEHDVSSSELFDELATIGSLTKWFDQVDELHTLTSLSGFEALMRGLPVYTYGGPFYAGWGLTNDRVEFPRRTRRLSLDELVAGTLILYAAYHDWVTGLACTPEAVIHRLTNPRLPARLRFRRNIFLGLRNAMRFFHLER